MFRSTFSPLKKTVGVPSSSRALKASSPSVTHLPYLSESTAALNLPETSLGTFTLVAAATRPSTVMLLWFLV